MLWWRLSGCSYSFDFQRLISSAIANLDHPQQAIAGKDPRASGTYGSSKGWPLPAVRGSFREGEDKRLVECHGVSNYGPQK